MEGLVAFLCSSAGAALVAGLFGLWQYWLKRRDEKKDMKQEATANEGKERETEKKALRYLMLYIIQERCKEYINAGEITMEELRSLRHWHELYHKGLGGNGDADALMKRVESLRIDTD